MYFSVFIGRLIIVKILDFSKCLGLSVCMNSFLISSLIKLAQAAPPKSKCSHRKLFYLILNFFPLGLICHLNVSKQIVRKDNPQKDVKYFLLQLNFQLII
jgi:hypothetical protein